MTTKLFLAASLLFTAMCFAQSVSYPTTTTPGYTPAGPGVVGGTYVGSGAGSNVSNTGINNVFVGFNSGFANTSGKENTFTGFRSGQSNTSGNFNTFNGQGAGQSNISGWRNSYFGNSGGYANQAGNDNTCIGYYAGNSNNSVVGGNVFLGSQSGAFNTGEKNIFLGYMAGKDELGSNKLYIANSATTNPLIYGEFATTGTGGQPGVLKFNARQVGIGYNSSGGFGTFPTSTTILPNLADYRLFVKGNILAQEIRVRTVWADYVFAKDYKLLSLKDTEKYIAENGHLPNMPSAAQVDAEGIALGNIAKLQQEKIEELTLHIIEQGKQIELLKAQNASLEELKAKVELLLNKQ